MKIATVGSIHSDGLSILEKNGCDVFEVTNLVNYFEFRFQKKHSSVFCGASRQIRMMTRRVRKLSGNLSYKMCLEATNIVTTYKNNQCKQHHNEFQKQNTWSLSKELI